MGIFLIVLILLFLCWPMIKRWMARFMANRAEDFIRNAAGMPPRPGSRKAMQPILPALTMAATPTREPAVPRAEGAAPGAVKTGLSYPRNMPKTWNLWKPSTTRKPKYAPTANPAELLLPPIRKAR